MTQDLHTYLLAHGVKPSMQRIAVMRYLKTHFTHPTADEVYSALSPSMPTLSKTTVYNTLKLLAAQGAIQSLDIDERHTRFDGDTSVHAHFRCRRCGAIHDLPIGAMPERLVTPGLPVTIDEVQVYYKGYCGNCKQPTDSRYNKIELKK